MKTLYISGFLGSQEDLRPIANGEGENIFVNVKEMVLNCKGFNSISSYLINKYGNDFDRAVGYSFGGRVVSRVDMKIRQRVYISANTIKATELESLERKKMSQYWDRQFKKNFNKTILEWESLPLFSGHSMNSYRKEHQLLVQEWGVEATTLYFKNFFDLEGANKSQSSEMYIFGEKDLKYKKISLQMGKDVMLKEIENAGHRCCYEEPCVLRKFLKESRV